MAAELGMPYQNLLNLFLRDCAVGVVNTYVLNVEDYAPEGRVASKPVFQAPEARRTELTGKVLSERARRQCVKAAAADSALGAENIVQWLPAVSTMDRAPACSRQIAWIDGKPGTRSRGVKSVSSPG